MTFTAVVVSHANRAGLERILDCLLVQSRPPDEILAFCSGYVPVTLVALGHIYPTVRFYEAEDKDDWGHHKRSSGLEAAGMEWVGFFNDDDWYEPTYVERMLGAAGESDVVYCAWNEQPGCVFASGSSTAGNFIVRTEVGRKAGYPGDRIYENDGNFINRLNSATKAIVKVDELLYHHNHG